MQHVEGTLVRKGSELSIRYRAEVDVVENHVNYKAVIGELAKVLETIEGQFDFDPSKLDVDAAVESFMQAHIDRADHGAA